MNPDPQLLSDLKAYIEATEVALDQAGGSCRSVEQLVADGDMSEVYGRVLAALRSNSSTPHENDTV